MKCLIAANLCVMSISSVEAMPVVSAEVAVFNGKIVDKSVDKFLTDYGARSDLTEFSVASEGGEVLAAIRLARWIKRKNLNVRVRTICYSGCANYLFVAGKKKIIETGAFVAWHGDADQKDLRELVAAYAVVLEKRKGGQRLTRSEKKFLKEYRLRFLGVSKAQREQADFYRTVAVDPRAGRFGQEPVNYPSDGWTFTVPALELLGIKNVIAPENYGHASYFLQFAPHAAMVNGGPLQVFDSLDGETITPITN